MRLKKIFFTFWAFSGAVEWSVHSGYLSVYLDHSSTLDDAKSKCVGRNEKVATRKLKKEMRKFSPYFHEIQPLKTVLVSQKLRILAMT